MRYVSLIRHGEYDPSPEGGVLTARGRKQAVSTGKRLSKLECDNIYASTMSRAMESATIIARHVDLDVRPGRDYLRESMPTGVRGHRVPLDARRAGRQRVETIIEKHIRPATKETHDVLVCHGNIIRAVVAMALGLKLTTWTKMFIHHGSFSQLVVLPTGRVALRHYNDIGHFTASLVSHALMKTKPR